MIKINFKVNISEYSYFNLSIIIKLEKLIDKIIILLLNNIKYLFKNNYNN